MTVKDGKITEATEEELFTYWLKRYDDVLSLDDFLTRIKQAGTNVIEEEE